MRPAVWCHALLRLLLPLPCALVAFALLPGLVLALRPGRSMGLLIAGLLALGLGALAWIAVRRALARMAARCPACGGRAMAAPGRSERLAYDCGTCFVRTESHWRADRLFPGLGLLAGLLLLLGVIARAPAGSRLPVGLALGLIPFFLAAIALIGDRLLFAWVRRVFPWTERVGWGQLLGGLAALTLGCGFTTVGLFGDESGMPSGRGPVVLAGLVFALAGCAMLFDLVKDALFGRKVGHAIATAIGLILLLAFAAIPIGIGLSELGRGELSLGAWLSAGTMLSLLALLAWVAVRDRRKKKG